MRNQAAKIELPPSADAEVVKPLALRVSEVAALLHLSRSQAYRLIDAGTIPSVRFGHVIRVPYHAIEALLTSD